MSERRQDLSELLVRFRSSGDVAAMAELYRRAAPELMLLAVHFGQRAGDAEDAVHATFVRAMESAATFDAERPLRPWLIGILLHMVRRDQARRRRQLDPRRLWRREVDDPKDLAERAELVESLTRTLDRMPATYREVLIRRWVDGEAPAEIAERLGLPHETVRTRLRRGTALLRRALPAGFATAVLVATSREAAAAIGERVVRRAAAIATPPDATRSWPRRLRRRWATAGGVVALVVLTIAGRAWWRAPAPPDRQIETAMTAVAGAGAVAASPTDAPVRQASDEPPRSPVDSAPPPRDALRVQVVWADGTPAPGVHVCVQPQRVGNSLLLERWVVSDDHGIARVAELDAGDYRLEAHRGGSTTCRVQPGKAASAILRVPAGVDLRGVITDGGVPLADAEIWISRRDHDDEGRVVVHTDAHGAFEVRSVQPGRSFSVWADGYAIRTIEPIVGGADQTRTVRIDMAEQRSRMTLLGRVVDEAGAPIANALVQIGDRGSPQPIQDEGGPSPPLVRRTDAEGRFGVRGLEIWARRLDVWARAPGFATGSTIVSYEPGTHDGKAKLRLARGFVVSGVVRGDDGQPRAGVEVTAWNDEAGDESVAPRWAASTATTDAAGAYHLRGVRGAVHLRASGGGERVSAARQVDADLSWDPVLRPPLVMEGFVVDEHGAPVPHLRVALQRPAGGFEIVPTVTDGQGRFRFADCEDERYALAVTAADSRWEGPLATRYVWPRDGPAQVCVPQRWLGRSRVIGRVVDEAGQPLAAHMFLAHSRQGIAYGSTDPATGRFEIAALPAFEGPFTLWIELDPLHLRLLDDIELQPDATVDCGDVCVGTPGVVQIRLRLPDGSPWPTTTAFIETPGGFPHSMAVLQSGEWRVDNLQPGSYVFSLFGNTLAQSATPFEIVAGQTTTLDLTVADGADVDLELHQSELRPAHRVRLQWLDEAGRPLCWSHLPWTTAEPLQLSQRLAFGTYTVRAISDTGCRAEATFSVPAKITLTLE